MSLKFNDQQMSQPEKVSVINEFKIGNEFTTVTIRHVVTPNGGRLEIESPKLGKSIRLDPLELESLTWQTVDTFSKFLESPFGPDGDKLE